MHRILLALIGWALLAVSAVADERITDFVSEVTINKDGSLDVTETITLMVEGKEIKRGILRDFPTQYLDRNGKRVSIGFDVLAIERDGRKEPYALEPINNGQRIRIGDKDVFLEFGPHTYRISYHTTRQLDFFGVYDEIYWNVTGNGWSFAIDRAEARIHLPPGAKIIQHAAYTGKSGETGEDFRVTQGEGIIYRAATTRRLSPGEGFTVAVGFTKGVVSPPEDVDSRMGTEDGRTGFSSLIALFVIVILTIL